MENRPSPEEVYALLISLLEQQEDVEIEYEIIRKDEKPLQITAL